jgi:DNA invertase Pin-like site-specific DNA recombinase
METIPIRVVGYTRVSKEEQAVKGVSLAAQAEKIRAYAALYDLDLVAVLEDGGYTAKNLNRPGLQEALRMLESGAAQGLLVAKLDRMSRSVSDVAYLIDTYFGDRARHGATLLSVADQVDTRTAAGRLVLNVLAAVSQWEREAIGERTKAALDYKKSQGVKLGAPETAVRTDNPVVVSLALDLKQKGSTLQEMADELTRLGYATKRGGRWAPETVRQLLSRHVTDG